MIVLNLTKKYKTFKATKYQEFPGSPVVRTQYFHCHGRGFNPWSGNQDSESCSVLPKKKKKKPTKYFHPPTKNEKDLKGILCSQTSRSNIIKMEILLKFI